MAKVKLIAGLGNPGKEYSETRHNIGFRVVDAFAEGFSGSWKKWQQAAELFEFSENHNIKLFKPLQYMNNSGFSIKQVMGYYKILPDETLVISDDFTLALGIIRLRQSGSSGGHNGLASIIDQLNTSRFPRLRLGIGPIKNAVDPADFVLSKFNKSEEKQVKTMIGQALAVIKNIIDEGIDKAASKIQANK